jgi:hypothetical protein
VCGEVVLLRHWGAEDKGGAIDGVVDCKAHVRQALWHKQQLPVLPVEARVPLHHVRAVGVDARVHVQHLALHARQVQRVCQQCKRRIHQMQLRSALEHQRIVQDDVG